MEFLHHNVCDPKFAVIPSGQDFALCQSLFCLPSQYPSREMAWEERPRSPHTDACIQTLALLRSTLAPASMCLSGAP